jgi:hypothetical protein
MTVNFLATTTLWSSRRTRATKGFPLLPLHIVGSRVVPGQLLQKSLVLVPLGSLGKERGYVRRQFTVRARRVVRGQRDLRNRGNPVRTACGRRGGTVTSCRSAASPPVQIQARYTTMLLAQRIRLKRLRHGAAWLRRWGLSAPWEKQVARWEGPEDAVRT